MDALTIMRRALGATGNNKINMLADPDFPDEWNAVNEGFARIIDDLTSRYSWPFARRQAPLVLTDTLSDTTERLIYVYDLPSDSLHLVGLKEGTGVLTDGWELRGNQILAAWAADLTAVYIAAPAHEHWHPQAAEILTRFLEAHLEREMNEDNSEAMAREEMAEARLSEGRSRVKQQDPSANVYVSSVARARRTRKA